MKVIDLLNKIANGEEVPKIIYDNKMYVFDKKSNWFEDFSNGDVMTVFRIAELNQEIEVVEIIEDTPKEEKKIPEKLDIYWELQQLIKDNNIDEHNLYKLLTKIEIKQNEIIDYLKSKGE